MSTSVSKIVSIPWILVLVTKFKGMGDCNEITGTHEVTTLYAGNESLPAITEYLGYTPLYGESVSYLILNKVAHIKEYKEVSHGKKSSQEIQH